MFLEKFVKFKKNYIITLYNRFGILKVCKGIFFINKFIIKEFGVINSKSSKVKTYDYPFLNLNRISNENIF